MRHDLFAAAGILGFAACVGVAAAQDTPPGRSTSVEIVAHVLEPAPLKPTDELIGRLKLPEGFTVRRFASDLGNARMIAADGEGRVYVTRRDEGDVLLLEDTDEDGRADRRETLAKREDMHGIALHDGRMYLTTVEEVFVADVREDGTLGELEPIIDDLPVGGQHPNRTLAVGPDRRLYISVGSTCNACDELDGTNASLLRANLDGGDRKPFATGLRNTIGFGWQPGTGALYGWDQGIDWLGDELQREEFNRIEEGARYGWPYIFEDGKTNPSDRPSEGTMADWAAASEEPALLYTAHSAGMQMAFYTGAQFPEEYRGDAFVALRGSWNRQPPSGYEVVRVRFEGGEPVAIEPFLTGFLFQRENGEWVQFGRLAGLAQMPDGSLLVGDDENGVLYRITHEG